MATDGVSLFYNPAFVETLNAAELAGVLAHEVMHPALQHHTRRGDRDRKRWNMACVYAINPLLLDAGLTLPKDVLIEHRFRGMSAERIYNLIEEQHDQSGANGEGENQNGSSSGKQDGTQTDNSSADGEPSALATPGGFGQVLDAPDLEGDDGDTLAKQAREWKIAVEQSENVEKLAGKLPLALLEVSNNRGRPVSTGASYSVAPGQRRFSPTTDGCRPIGGTSGLGYIFQVSGAKARGRSPSPSTAQDRSMRVSWVSSRRKFAPFLMDSGRARRMCSTSILKSIRPRSIKRGSRSYLPRWAEGERTSRPASGGWTNVESCRRPLYSLQIFAALFPKKFLDTRYCGHPLSRGGHHSGRSFLWKRLSPLP
jgi:hypothetical protein